MPFALPFEFSSASLEKQRVAVASGTFVAIIDTSNDSVVASTEPATTNPTQQLISDLPAKASITGIALSRAAQHLAVTTDDKGLHLYADPSLGGSNDASGNKWHLLLSAYLPKRATKVLFADFPGVADGAQSETIQLLVADKFGDVWRWTLPFNGASETIKVSHLEPDVQNQYAQLAVGHVSIVTDVALATVNNRKKFIVTADRDEKIRVTHYPNAHNIEAMCLGHKSFVSAVTVLNATGERPILLSGDGDGLIIGWDMLTGNEITRYQVADVVASQSNSEEPKKPLVVKAIHVGASLINGTSTTGYIAVVVEDVPDVIVYKAEISTGDATPAVSLTEGRSIALPHVPLSIFADPAAPDTAAYVSFSTQTQQSDSSVLVQRISIDSSVDPAASAVCRTLVELKTPIVDKLPVVSKLEEMRKDVIRRHPHRANPAKPSN
ncbi:hypothetical protein GQ42DRAFT_164832 [Ramicandelaber brevisporus]|nr:hypothetical protein GQ42DRAFT_164832 [Ramicandelaber brevisporus]